MTFGLCCSQPACRPHQASLPVRVPAVESLLRASFSFASRLRLAFRYGCRHLLRRAPFISIDSAHAGHTGAASLGGPTAFRPACLLTGPPGALQALPGTTLQAGPTAGLPLGRTVPP